MTRIDRTLRLTLDALFVALLGAVLAAAILSAILPMLGHPVLTVTGGSMVPAIPVGAAVVEDRVAPADLRAGDIASFRLPNGSIVTHRIDRIADIPAGRSFQTKGDANAAPDPVLLSGSALIGRVEFQVPVMGYVMWLLHLPSGILAIATGAASLYLAGRLLEPESEVDGTVGPERAPLAS